MCWSHKLRHETYQAPGSTGESSGHASVPSSDNGTEIGTKGRTGIEADPSEPEHEGSKSNECDIVRTEVDELAFTTTAESP